MLALLAGTQSCRKSLSDSKLHVTKVAIVMHLSNVSGCLAWGSVGGLLQSSVPAPGSARAQASEASAGPQTRNMLTHAAFMEPWL